MTNAPLFLRPDVLAEPLIARWHALAYLLSPASRAMFVAGSHLKLLRAFSVSARVHESALKTPANRGGPYVDLPASAAPEVKALFEKATAESGPLVAFADAVRAVDRVLAEEAKGYSLEQLYKKVPDAIRGLVELVYDMNDNPSLRVMEGLLFQTAYYEPEKQALRLCLDDPDARPFALSTPRLTRDGDLDLHLPFASPALDALFASRRVARPLAELAADLGLEDGEARLAPFFTHEAPPAHAPFDGEGVRVRGFGHAGVLIEAGGKTILVDPVVSPARPGDPSRPTLMDLPASIDCILITSSRPDHFCFETLLELRHKTRELIVPRSGGGGLADPSLQLILQHTGFRSVREIGDLETITPTSDVSITALPFLGGHGDLDIRSKVGFAVRLAGKTLVLLSDATLAAPRVYERVAALLGPVDAVFLGLHGEGAPMSWLYGPLFTRPVPRKNDLARRLDAATTEAAKRVVDLLSPRHVFLYGLGREPWLGHVVATPSTGGDAQTLLAHCAARSIEAAHFDRASDVLL